MSQREPANNTAESILIGALLALLLMAGCTSAENGSFGGGQTRAQQITQACSTFKAAVSQLIAGARYAQVAATVVRARTLFESGGESEAASYMYDWSDPFDGTSDTPAGRAASWVSAFQFGRDQGNPGLARIDALCGAGVVVPRPWTTSPNTVAQPKVENLPIPTEPAPPVTVTPPAVTLPPTAPPTVPPTLPTPYWSGYGAAPFQVVSVSAAPSPARFGHPVTVTFRAVSAPAPDGKPIASAVVVISDPFNDHVGQPMCPPIVATRISGSSVDGTYKASCTVQRSIYETHPGEETIANDTVAIFLCLDPVVNGCGNPDASSYYTDLKVKNLITAQD